MSIPSRKTFTSAEILSFSFLAGYTILISGSRLRKGLFRSRLFFALSFVGVRPLAADSELVPTTLQAIVRAIRQNLERPHNFRGR